MCIAWPGPPRPFVWALPHRTGHGQLPVLLGLAGFQMWLEAAPGSLVLVVAVSVWGGWGSVSFLSGPPLSDSAILQPLWAHWTMPENVLMGIRRGLALALVLSISSWCELSPSTLDFWAPEHGSGQGATSNLWAERRQLGRPISGVRSVWAF